MTKRKALTPKVQIVYRAVDSLQADPNNARIHPPEQLERLRASIRRYGFTKPVALKADDKTIGAGNGAWEAARLEGLKEIPTITLALSDDDWTAYAVADNKLPMGAQWDEKVLTATLDALYAKGHDLGDMGFTPLELGTLGVTGFALEQRLDEADETPDPPKTAIVKSGELWVLGDHRLIIGDSTDKEIVSRLFNGARPNLLVTDPPYGVNYDPTWRVDTNRFARGSESHGKVQNDSRADWREAWALFPGNIAYVWHGGLHAGVVQASLEAADFAMRTQIVWAKQHFVFSRGDYHWQHEPCWYAVKKGAKGSWSGDRKQTTVWEIKNPNPMGGSRDDGQTGHGTQKPIECMRRPILNNSKPGDAVYDPFCGSGTTLIAAHMEKRKCFAVELDPIYAQVIIERWEAFAKGVAKREDGKTLSELKKAPKAKK